MIHNRDNLYKIDIAGFMKSLKNKLAGRRISTMFDYKLIFVVKNKQITYYFVNEEDKKKMNTDTSSSQVKLEDLIELEEKPKKKHKKSKKSKQTEIAPIE